MLKANDPVNHPSHYTQGGIECIDALTAMVTGYEDPNDAALTWQVGKYIWRHPFKSKPIEDLKKARFYLDRLIRYLETKAYLTDVPPAGDAVTSGVSTCEDAYARMKADYEARIAAKEK